MYKYKVIKEGVETRGVISKDEKGKPIVTMTEVPVVYLIRMMADDEKAKGKRSLTVFRDAFLRDYSMTA